jgi:hypothetical protein
MNRLQHFQKYLSVATVAVVGLGIAGLAHAANPDIKDLELDGNTIHVRATGLGNVMQGDDVTFRVASSGDVLTMCSNPAGMEVEAQSTLDTEQEFPVDIGAITKNGNFTDYFDIEAGDENPCPNGRWTPDSQIVMLDEIVVTLFVGEMVADTAICNVVNGECT